jgi:sulfur relay (sulfurtransferase) complex TusBCD TusD component (DsrE family)
VKLFSILYTNLPNALYQMEQHTETIESATKANEQDATNVKAFFRRTVVLSSVLDWKSASDAFLAIAKLQPTDQNFLKQMQVCKDKLLARSFRTAMTRDESERPAPVEIIEKPM